MTPKQFHMAAVRAYKDYKLTYLVAAVSVSDHYHKGISETITTFQISIQCTYDHIYSNLSDQVLKTPQLSIAAGLHWLKGIAKIDPTILKSYKPEEHVI